MFISMGNAGMVLIYGRTCSNPMCCFCIWCSCMRLCAIWSIAYCVIYACDVPPQFYIHFIIDYDKRMLIWGNDSARTRQGITHVSPHILCIHKVHKRDRFSLDPLYVADDTDQLELGACRRLVRLSSSSSSSVTMIFSIALPYDQ